MSSTAIGVVPFRVWHLGMDRCDCPSRMDAVLEILRLGCYQASRKTGRSRTRPYRGAAARRLLRLRHFHKARRVVALSGEAFEDAAVGFIGQGGFAGENPAVIAGRMADHGPLVVGIEIDDEVAGANEA